MGDARPSDLRFDLPPRFETVERRLASRALDRWRAGGRAFVAGFDDHSLVIADPGGMACIIAAGAGITATFGLAAGMHLDGRTGLAAEVRAACDLIAIDPQPLPFEASLAAEGRACILLRGVALPIGPAADPVQIVISWRELLDRAATSRLRREVGSALRSIRPATAHSDPFAAEITR